MTTSTRSIVASLLLAVFFGGSAFAQGFNPYTNPPPTTPTRSTPLQGVPCMPYNDVHIEGVPNCSDIEPEYVSIVTFGNAFVNGDYTGGTFITIVNESDELNRVVIKIQRPSGQPNRAPLVYTESLTLEPNEMVEPLRINELAMLADYNGGVSITVSGFKRTTATVACHPPVGPTFWTGARILEGSRER